jgi:phosphate transport system protein
MALQAPVASELRLITALFHVNIHLERVGGLCVNLSRVAQDSGPPSDEPELTAYLQEMAVHARTVLSKAVEALTRRDRDAAYELPRLDDPLDQLNASVFRRLVHMAAADEARMNRAMRLVLVARYLERIGDHGVDIGEQVVFAVTGQSVELESEPA